MVLPQRMAPIHKSGPGLNGPDEIDVQQGKGRRTVTTVLRFFLFSLLLCAGGYTAATLFPNATPKEDRLNIPAPRVPKIPKNQYSYSVKSGDTFFGILSQFGVVREVSNRVYNTLKPLGLCALYPGDSVVVHTDVNGALLTFSLQSRLQNWFHALIDSGKVRAERKPVKTAVYRCIVRGTLSTSLSEDLVKLGIGDACVAMFADIFAWDINFFVDPQKGDSFDIVVEKKYADGRFVGYGNILAARYVNNGKVYTALGLRKQGEIYNYFDNNGKSLQKQFLKAPLRFSHISSRFSFHRKHPILGIVRPHLGIDYAAPPGTPVYAAADGTVRFADFNAGFGRQIRIDHGGSYETYYGHLQAFAGGIRTGRRVMQGDCIGWVGQTGLATGPHLDYRMARGGGFVNPLTVSLPGKEGITPSEKSTFLGVKKEYETLFGLRLANTLGCYLLDITANSAVGAAKDTAYGG
jgi:murein DD-endopeptidase MepM/ murein hydrolase activator NlpD